MTYRLVVVGLACWLSIPASARQTIRLGAASIRLLPPPASRLDILPSISDADPSGAVPQATSDKGSKGQLNLWARPDEPGSWIPFENGCDIVKGPPPPAWEKQLKAIAALVRACPVFREIRGYYPTLAGW